MAGGTAIAILISVNGRQAQEIAHKVSISRSLCNLHKVWNDFDLCYMLRLSLNWHHVWSWLSLTHSQSMTRKAVCLAANSKGNARLNENYFLVGLSFTSRFPSQTTLDEICWMPFEVVIFSPPSPSVQVRIFYQLPKELKYHTIGYNFSLIESRSAQAWGPTYSWSTSYLSSEKAGQDKF